MQILANQKQKAVVALTTLMVVSAIMLFGGITLLLTSLDTSRVSLSSSNSIFAEVQATSCLEESMYRLRLDINYSGTFPLSFPYGTCNASVSVHGTNPNYRVITINSVYDKFSYSVSKTVDVTVNPFTFVD